MSPASIQVGEFGDDERLAWLRLARAEGIGPARFGELIARFNTARDSIEALEDASMPGGRSGPAIRIPPAEAAARECEALHRIGARLVALPETSYPAWLRESPGAPPVLAVAGTTEILPRSSIAIVGSRNASAAGRRFAARLAAELGAEGFVIVSGLARGIDAAAHEASLNSGTIGVLAGGLDRPYPRENVPLMERLVEEGGAIVSEMPLGRTARAQDFPRRNRIVAGMAVATVVIEAAERSGSLITARLAAEQGREVFAVPGSPLDPRAAGCNRLLKNGAQIVTDVADILGAVAPQLERTAGAEPRSQPTEPPCDLAAASSRPAQHEQGEPARGEQERILEALGHAPVAVDDIVRASRVSAAAVQTALIELELAGRIERHPGQRVSLRP